MPRWEPQARDRLRDAALELFLAHGFDNVTVAQITERAGLTRRTFSRYFTDKRDVLFAGSEQLPAVLAAAVRRADPDLAPFTALLTALTEVGDLVADEHAAERRAIVQASPELQERGLTKYAAVTSALAAALEQRGAAAATAALLAPVGTAIFRAALDRWAEQPACTSLADRIRDTAAELAANMQPPPRRAGTAAGQQPGGRPDAAEPGFSEMARRVAELGDTQTCAVHGSPVPRPHRTV
jgi:AcrR family transcriptional regulator